ncbi:MAG: DinB family protein [Terriglobales bacterium]
MPASTNNLREHVLALLRGGSAHATLEQCLRGLDFEIAGRRPARAPHNAWQLLEHIRIAQSDILEYSRRPGHISPDFPAGYWPPTPAPPSAAAWRRSRAQLRADLAAFIALVADPARDLLAPLPQAPDKTLLREALVLADHNAYHLGALVQLRKLLGAW